MGTHGTTRKAAPRTCECGRGPAEYLHPITWKPGDPPICSHCVLDAVRPEQDAGKEADSAAWMVERRGVKAFGWHPVNAYLRREHAENVARVIRGGEWEARIVPLYRGALRSDSQAEAGPEDIARRIARDCRLLFDQTPEEDAELRRALADLAEGIEARLEWVSGPSRRGEGDGA